MRQMSGTLVLEKVWYNPRLVLEHFKDSCAMLNEMSLEKVWYNPRLVLEHFKDSSAMLNETNVFNNNSRQF